MDSSCIRLADLRVQDCIAHRWRSGTTTRPSTPCVTSATAPGRSNPAAAGLGRCRLPFSSAASTAPGSLIPGLHFSHVIPPRAAPVRCAGVTASPRRAMPCSAAGVLRYYLRADAGVRLACWDSGVCSTRCALCAAVGRRRSQLPSQRRCQRASDLLDWWCLLVVLCSGRPPALFAATSGLVPSCA